MLRHSFFSFLRKSFYVRMIAIMLVVSVVPLLSLAYVSLTLFGSSFENQLNRANDQVVSQVTERIETTMDRLQQLSFQYALQPSVTNALVADTSLFSTFERAKDLIEMFDTGILVIGDADDLLLYNDATRLVLSSKQAVATLDESPYRRIVEMFIESEQSFDFMSVDRTEADPELLRRHSYFLRRIPVDPLHRLKGVLIISVDNRSFEKLIEPIDFGPKASFYIASPQGNVIAASTPAGAGEEIPDIREVIGRWQAEGRPSHLAVGSSVAAVKQSDGFYPWIVISIVPNDEMAANTRIVRNTLITFVAGLAGLGLLGVIGLGYSLYRPLQRIKHHMRKIEKGDFSQRIHLKVNNEIGELGNQLNLMSSRLQSLIDELKETEDAKRKQEIRALQAQINPHFLYNCLNSISMFAMLRDYDKIREMMASLLFLLRYSMENVEHSVPLGKELAYLDHYMRMMQLRYSRPFRLETAVEEPLSRMTIPKLLLQPLIENALFHGVLASESDREGIIRIEARREEDRRTVLLAVSDNGRGMDPDRAERIRSLLASRGSRENIGLRNVWERVQLVYGASASIEFDSEPGEGTAVRIHIPFEQVHFSREESADEA